MRSPARLLIVCLLVASCGGGTVQTTTTAATATSTSAAATTTTTAAPATTTTLATTDSAVLEFRRVVQAGTQFEVDWTGPDSEGDYVTIVAAGAPERTYQNYFYTADGPTGTLTAPTTAGVHEVRYLDGATGDTVASVPITVAGRMVTLEVPVEVDAGTEFEVSWDAIPADGDFLTIVPASSPVGTYASYFYTTEGSTGPLVAPMNEGEFEVRYVSGLDGATMAATPIEVAALEITIEAPAEVAPGSQFEVSWTGPNGPGDYLTIVPAGAADTVYLDYAYTSEGSTVTLTAPEEAGDYEVRYRTDRLAGVFASVEITVD